jgi:predicted permease
LSFPYFDAIREASDTFSMVAAYMAPVPVVLSETGFGSERIWAHVTTPEYFDVLGATTSLGRTFEADRARVGVRQVVISHRLWQSRFGGDTTVVGRIIRVNGAGVEVLGVAAPEFLGASPTIAAADLWIPTTAPPVMAPELEQQHLPHAAVFQVVGRLRPGVTVDQAEDALEPLVRQLEVVHDDPRRDRQESRVRILPGGRMLAIRDEDVPRAVGFPVVLVSLVLVMACGNVANMLLARSAARRREIAVRLSLGAGPGRVVRQLLAESLILTVAGAAAGAVIGLGLLSFFDSLRPMLPDYGFFEVRFDWPSFAAATLLAGLSVVSFGLAPARQASRQDISVALKPNGSPSGRRRSWVSLQNLLVFQQVTASVLLLLLTSFIVIGWQRSASVDPGFNPTHLYLVRLDPVRDGHSAERTRQVFDRLPDRLRENASVTSVSVAQTLPTALASGEAMLTAKADIAAGSESLGAVRTDFVGAEFFETIGAPMVRGRDFTVGDAERAAGVAIISAAMASRLWPGEDAVGRTIDLDGKSSEVVGVAGDLKSAFPLMPTSPAVYRPLDEAGFAQPSHQGVVLVARVRPGVDAPSLLRREIEAFDPSVTVFGVTRVTDELDDARFLARFATLIYGGMGVFGLALASVGLAGVTAHAVARRRREIGIRMALGARRGSVLWLVLRESSIIIGAGTVVGVVLAIAVARALASIIETLAEATRTSLTDPLIVIGGPVLLAAVALLACYLPARQSTRIDPTTALRAE